MARNLVRWIALALLLGCVDARGGAGAECSRNGQCAAPLVCAHQRCRNECNQSRDCPVGSSCVRSESGFGVCLLENETSCSDDGRCAGELICRFERCTTECAAGCAPGTECREDACFDESMDQSCARDGDCADGACIAGRCRIQCRSDRDCRFGNTCFSGVCVSSDFDAAVDAPGLDAGPGGDPFCPPRTVDVVDVCIGREHACAVLSDGRAVCWGSNGGSALGSSTLPLVDVFAASPVEGVSGAVRVECSAWGGCVVHTDGTSSCWGTNFVGQTGTGSLDNTVIPRPLSGLDDVVDLDLRVGGGCAINGTAVHCWGTNDDGELGAAGPGVRAPVLASDLPPSRSVSVEEDGAIAFGFVVATTGELVRFGGDPFGGTVDLTLAMSDLIEVTAGERHVCVRRESGEVLCAGDNDHGQLGDPGATGTSFAVVPGLSANAIRARGNATCAITDTGGVCWGENMGGGLGVGTRADQATPAPVSFGGVAPSVLEARHEFGCGVFAGAAYCFGRFDGDRGRRGLPPMSEDSTEPTLPVRCLP